jgi:hypothetical protein
MESPYKKTVSSLQAEPSERQACSPQKRSHDRRITQLPAVWGEELDRLGATYYQLRWVAGPGASVNLPLVERRYRALVAHLKEGKYGSKAFDELVARVLEEEKKAKAVYENL